MSLTHSMRFGAVAAAVALAAPVVSAGPPGHAGGAHVGGAHVAGARVAPVAGAHVAPVAGARVAGATVPYYHYSAPYYRSAPYYSGYRGYSGVGISIGLGYGSGLYGPLGYGLGYSPFGYSGIGYGGLGYGALGYGYGYPSTRSVIGLPSTYDISIPYQYLPPQSMVPPDFGDPTPLPLPLPGANGAAQGEPATITVITSAGATVSFDGLASEQTGTRHSFTTKPIASGAQSRVMVKVNGPGGASSVSINVRSGEKATVDMRN